jgi:SAM-dependent methyltransferase
LHGVPAARHWYRSLSDWTDPGDAAAVAWVADEVRGQPLLDVGVGADAPPLLRNISLDYTAVDYTPELVAICRRNHPDTRVHYMDAHDMSAFKDNSFALGMFSFNGIDSVDYAGRCAIFREFARVLRRGGLALFSTHNLHGPSYRENLSHLLYMPDLSASPIAVGIDTATMIYSLPFGTFNFLRYSRLNREFDSYVVRISTGFTSSPASRGARQDTERASSRIPARSAPHVVRIAARGLLERLDAVGECERARDERFHVEPAGGDQLDRAFGGRARAGFLDHPGDPFGRCGARAIATETCGQQLFRRIARWENANERPAGPYGGPRTTASPPIYWRWTMSVRCDNKVLAHRECLGE